jgi:hypothetical protein
METLTSIESSELSTVHGGGLIAPDEPRPEPNQWVDNLSRTLSSTRGFEPNADPKMEITPPNPDMDRGIWRGEGASPSLGTIGV